MSRMERQPRSRRELLRAVGRGTALTGLAGLALWLTGRRARSAADGPCAIAGPCRGCGQFNQCSLPRAQRSRREEGTGKT